MPTLNLRPRKDYRSFVFSSANRDIREGLRERIADRIEDMNLLDLYPIVATTDGMIMDGQHRFSVARDMSCSFYVVSGDDITIKDVAEANANTQRYDDVDAMHVYAKMGLAPYVHIRDFLASNSCVRPLGFAMRLMNSEITRPAFIDGSFSVQRPQYAQAVANCIADVIPLLPANMGKWIPSSPYRNAFANLLLNPVYDHARMIDRIKKVPSRLLKCGSVSEAMAMLEHVYNFNKSRDNVVKLSLLPKTQQVDRYRKDGEIVESEFELPVRHIGSSRVVEIRCSSDLNSFTIHPSCRPVKPLLLERLVDFMRRRDLLRYFPIIVDRNLVVYDGQKRLLAARALGLNIHYIVADNISIWMMVQAGGRKENWGARDYLKHYCEMGHPDYLYLRDFHSAHNWYALSSLIQFFSARTRKTVALNEFTSGKFSLVGKRKVDTLTSFLRVLRSDRLRADSSIHWGFWMLLESNEYDMGRLVRNLNKYPSVLGAYFDRDSCIERLIEIYNYRA